MLSVLFVLGGRLALNGSYGQRGDFLLEIAARGAGRGALGDHVGVLLDAVEGLDTVALGGGVAAVRGPGEEVTSDLDVVVGELAMLVVVHAEEFGLLGGTELEAGDEVDGLGDDGGDDECVGGATDNGGNLPADEDVVAVHEATLGTSVDAVETDDTARGEEGVEEEADNAADTVLSENIEGVVDTNEELDC